MSRRRFFKSFFYINYGGTAHGETVIVSPFVAGGASDTIELVSGKPWVITNGLTWLTVSSLSNKSGTYTITLTASQNTEHSQRTGSFTAKTLDDKYSIVVSVSQEAAPSEKHIRIEPTSVNMDAVDNYNALKCYFSYNGSETEVTPTWASNNTAVTISTYGVLSSNNTTPNPLTVTITATYVHEGDTLTATATVNVAAAEIERYITVSPAGPIALSATGSQQLDVIYHEIINGVETTENVTTASTYSSPNTAITVNSTGLITANNTGTTTETANITISYSDVTPITVSVQASPANVEYRNLRTVPTTMTLDSGDTPSGVEIQALVDVYVNGTKTGEENVTHATGLVWSSEHTDVATVGWNGTIETVVPIYNSSSYYPSNRYVNIIATYASSSATCQVTVLPEGRKEYSLVVEPSTTAISSTGGVQLAASFVTKTDGVITGTEIVTTASTYNTSSGLISVTAGGYVTGQGSQIGGTATVNVEYTNQGVTYSGTSVITVQGTSTEYKNLTVNPITMTLDYSNFSSGKTITATVDVFVDGTYSDTIDVTSAIGNGWTTSDNTAAIVSWAGQWSREIVLPIYNTEQYYPTSRTVTITANYLGSAATCDVTVLPEGRQESELIVNPSAATIAYNGTTALTVTYYEFLDGVQQTVSNVTTAATYDKGSSTYLNVVRGSITGTNQTTTAQTVPIRVSYASQDYPLAAEITTITVQGKPNYTYALEVTPASSSISYSGTVQLTVILVAYADGHEESRTDVTRGYGTNYNVTAGNTYISVNNNGLVTGINSSTTTGTGEIMASFNIPGYGTIYGYSYIEVGAAPAPVVVTGITANILSVPNIPASGGTVDCTMATYEVRAYFSDGNYETVPRNSYAIVDCSAVTSQTLCTTATTAERYAGNLWVKVSYTCGTTFYATDSHGVYQEINEYWLKSTTPGTTEKVPHSETRTGTPSYSISVSPSTQTVDSNSGSFNVVVSGEKNTPTTSITYNTWYETTTYVSGYTSGCERRETVTGSTIISGDTSQTAHTATTSVACGAVSNPVWVTATTSSISYSQNTGSQRSGTVVYRVLETQNVTGSCTITQEAYVPPTPGTRTVNIYGIEPFYCNYNSGPTISERTEITLEFNGGAAGTGYLVWVSNNVGSPGASKQFTPAGSSQFFTLQNATTESFTITVSCAYVVHGTSYGQGSINTSSNTYTITVLPGTTGVDIYFDANHFRDFPNPTVNFTF